MKRTGGEAKGGEGGDGEGGGEGEREREGGQRDDPVTKRTRLIKSVLDNMTEEELTRFEFFSRSHLSRNRVRELMTEFCGQPVTDETAIIVAGLTKQFIGELTDTAVDVTKEEKRRCSVQVPHIQEAYRRMQLEGKAGRMADRGFLFQMHSMGTDDSLVDVYPDDSDDQGADMDVQTSLPQVG